jgi:hypothetical protein
MSNTRPTTDRTAQALEYALVSPNEGDSNGEPANVVNGLFANARALFAVAQAIKANAPADLPGLLRCCTSFGLDCTPAVSDRDATSEP